MTKFIVHVHDGIEPQQAFRLCASVAEMGLISGAADKKQHCYVITFTDGTVVQCVKRGKSERFVVQKEELTP